MESASYKQTLEKARNDLTQLLRKRDEIDARISKLTTAIDSLSLLCDEPQVELPHVEGPETFTANLRDAIRLIFNAARPSALTPTEVRDKLLEMGFPLRDRYKYELPPIHNTIARLEASAEIERADRPDGEKAYKFVGVFARAARRAKEEEQRWKPLAHNFAPWKPIKK